MPQALRIARVLSRLNLGGPARQVLASDPLLVARGHTVRIFAGEPQPGEGDLFESARERGLDVVRVRGLSRGVSLTGDLRAAAFLKRELRAFAPDVLHTHASKAGALGRRAASGLGHTARVHTFHGHVLERYFGAAVSRGLASFERRLARGTDRIVAVSHATADDLVRLGIASERQLVVIPPGIELDALLAIPLHGPGRRLGTEESGALRKLLQVPDEAWLVGVVGRLAEVKRPEWALEVFELLAARYPSLQLVFVGDGDRRGMLERRILGMEPPLRERVHLAGALDDMLPVLRDLDAVLLCSHSEGLPVSLIEAGAAALPVVATRVGGVPELVVEERTGYIGENVEELAYGLAQLLEHPTAAAAMGQRARTRVAKRHDAHTLADHLERLYRAVVEERACAS
jgi:glycosyltransferase involved in cell wall biosynthesis